MNSGNGDGNGRVLPFKRPEPGPIPIQKCRLCEKWAVSDAKAVRFIHEACIDLDTREHPEMGAELGRTVPACEEHRPEVAYRVAWNIYHKHIAPILLKKNLSPPTGWAVAFEDGKVIQGSFNQPDPDT